MPPVFALQPGRALFLASASPRRRELLASLGLPFEIIRPLGAEPLPRAGEDPQAFALRSARAKAEDAMTRLPEGRFLLIAADTIVCQKGDIMGKPADPEEALRFLARLSGAAHQVISAVSLAWNEGGSSHAEAFAESSEVSFYSWPAEILRNYAFSGEPLDKAGAYAIQGAGAFLVQSIRGSCANVIGLPIAALAVRLAGLGLIFPAS